MKMILKADPQKLASPALMWGIVFAGIMLLIALFKNYGMNGARDLPGPIFLNKMAGLLFGESEPRAPHAHKLRR